MNDAPSCRVHPQAAAVSTCTSCLAPLCGGCLQFERYQAVCAPCGARLRKARRRRFALFLSLGSAAAVPLVVLGLWMLLNRSPDEESRLSGEAVNLEQRLRESPCDRSLVIELGDELMRVGAPRRALGIATAFFHNCGEYPRLRWITYSAHQQLGEWDAAIADASLLIETYPTDKDYRWWRGMIYEQSGRLPQAAEDYEKAIELEPALTSIPVNLADVYARMKRPCDEKRTLERFLKAYPSGAAEMGPRLQKAAARCTPPAEGTEL